jgi:transposase
MNPTTHGSEANASAPVLYMALELSNKTWRLALSDGAKRRQVTVPAADLARLAEAVAKAKARFGIPVTARVLSCYEAGRDGLVGTPYNSGESERDQGISKAGNRRVRAMIVEIAWLWLRFQPGSALSHWYRTRFADGGLRMRRIGIVALARRLLIARWRYLEDGVIPQGARLIASEI